MSREVLGNAPVDAAPTPDPGSRDASTVTNGYPSPDRPCPPESLAVTLAIAALIGLVCGWLGDAAWRSAQAADSRSRTAGLSAVIRGEQRTDETPLRTSASFTLHLTNLGLVPVEVVGSEPSYAAAMIVALHPEHVTVPVNRSLDAVLDVRVGCHSPRPLDLPPLRARTPDGAALTVVVDRAGQVLANLCEGGSAADHLLQVVAADRDGPDLRLRVIASSGRTTQLQTVRTGGVALATHPRPTMVDGGIHTLWLQPPASCPTTWRQTGFPEDLQADVDVGARATITLPIGFALAAWLLEGACAGSPT